MEQSLIAAVSGIQANQTYLDVVGSNMANADTTGYKTRMPCSPTSSPSRSPARRLAPGGFGRDRPHGRRRRCARRRGDQRADPGRASEETNQPTDLAIQGNGYLIAVQNGATMYTRAGHLTLDADGDLSTPVGGIIQGWMGPTSGGATGPIKIQLGSTNAAGASLESFSIGTDGSITGTYSDGTSSRIGQIALATFANPGGLAGAGNTMYTPSANSGVAVVNQPGSGGAGTLVAGSLEGSNVDLASQLTDLIVAQEAYQANTKVVSTTSNSLASLMQMT